MAKFAKRMQKLLQKQTLHARNSASSAKDLQSPDLPAQPSLVEPSNSHGGLMQSHLPEPPSHENHPTPILSLPSEDDEWTTIKQEPDDSQDATVHATEDNMPVTHHVQFMFNHNTYSSPTANRQVNHHAQNASKISKKRNKKNKKGTNENSDNGKTVKTNQPLTVGEAQESQANVVNDVTKVPSAVNMLDHPAQKTDQSFEKRIQDYRDASDRAVRDAKRKMREFKATAEGMSKVLRYLGMKKNDLLYLIAAYKDKGSAQGACLTIMGTRKIEMLQAVLKDKK